MKKPAVFMDRDGTVNEQMGYINHPDRFVLLPGVGKAIHLLNEAGFLTIIVTNQSGVARGYFPVDLVYQVHEKMKRLIKKDGATLDGIYFCPHYPQGKVSPYGTPCDCRKPGIGLIREAEASFDIDMDNSWVIGDRSTDIKMAHRAGLKGILVKTGYGRGDLKYVFPEFPFQPSHVAEDLLDAVKWILG
ncbi:MAG: HAD family hydrolase [Deltaproteobacteria bacterium]|nr:HAD family hydrolase [Deltaproteobacteria bacterium]